MIKFNLMGEKRFCLIETYYYLVKLNATNIPNEKDVLTGTVLIK